MDIKDMQSHIKAIRNFLSKGGGVLDVPVSVQWHVEAIEDTLQAAEEEERRDQEERDAWMDAQCAALSV